MIVTGIGTDVGKTIAAGILVRALKLPYWKPVQTGPESDADLIRMWNPEAMIYPSTHLKERVSPHHAARLENVQFDISLPTSPMIVESTGGILVPFSLEACFLDYFLSWQVLWVVVSRHYLGSINHTLMTLEILKRRGAQDIALVFNGTPNPDSEQAILHYSKVRCIGRILPETHFDSETIKKYSAQWKL